MVRHSHGYGPHPIPFCSTSRYAPPHLARNPPTPPGSARFRPRRFFTLEGELLERMGKKITEKNWRQPHLPHPAHPAHPATSSAARVHCFLLLKSQRQWGTCRICTRLCMQLNQSCLPIICSIVSVTAWVWLNMMCLQKSYGLRIKATTFIDFSGPLRPSFLEPYPHWDTRLLLLKSAVSLPHFRTLNQG